MGTKRIGLARVEALMENLKREIAWGQSTLVGQKLRVKSVGNATTTLTADDSGCYCLFDNATASTVILPLTKKKITNNPIIPANANAP